MEPRCSFRNITKGCNSRNFYGVCFLLALSLLYISASSTPECEKIFEDLRKTKRIMPRTNGNALQVTANIYLYSMTSVSELNTEYSVRMLYGQTWVDERLAVLENCTPFLGDYRHANDIWIPSVLVVNSKEIGPLSKISDGATRIRINGGGQVVMINRVDMRLLCRMEFHKYPLDKQNCSLEIESSSIPVEKMELRWSKNPIQLFENFYVTGYYLTNYSVSSVTSEYTNTGNYSRLIAHFLFKREFGNFILDIYIPGVLFVVTSWTSFWVEIPAAPARVTLGITTMLTLITSEKSVREKLPKMSYVHALDIWNVICTVSTCKQIAFNRKSFSVGFIFASLLEYALVNYIYHKDKRRKPGGMRRAGSSTTIESMDTDLMTSYTVLSSVRTLCNSGERREQSPALSRAVSTQDFQVGIPATPEVGCGPWILQKVRPQDIANGIDRKCRIIFPVAFIVFNVVYWTVLWV